MLPHDELYHYGTKGMRWGIRKSSAAKASAFQRKADMTSNQIRKAGAGSSRANRLMKKYKRYQSKAQKYQRLDAKRMTKTANKAAKHFDKKMDPRSKTKNKAKFDDALFKIGTTVVASTIIGRLAGPTVDIFGKKIANHVAEKMAEKAARKAFGL